MVVIPFRRRRKIPKWSIIAGAFATAMFAFAAVSAFLVGQGTSRQSALHQGASPPIEAIEGDTVRFEGKLYRLVGFNTPEKGDWLVVGMSESERTPPPTG
jgi:hypothetical protein